MIAGMKITDPKKQRKYKLQHGNLIFFAMNWSMYPASSLSTPVTFCRGGKTGNGIIDMKTGKDKNY